MTARLDQIELAATQAGRIAANVILSVIPGARHNPGRMRLPPLPDQLYEWEPCGYPATVVCEDDEEIASGFRSFGVRTVSAGPDPVGTIARPAGNGMMVFDKPIAFDAKTTVRIVPIGDTVAAFKYQAPDLFVIAHADRLTEKSVHGVLALAERSKWFVLLMQTCDDWESGRVEHEPRADLSPSILAPREWWLAAVENVCERAKLRDDLIIQATVLARRLGQPRPVDSILLYETR